MVSEAEDCLAALSVASAADHFSQYCNTIVGAVQLSILLGSRTRRYTVSDLTSNQCIKPLTACSDIKGSSINGLELIR